MRSADAVGPDPRPRVAATADGIRVEGRRCIACGYSLALPAPWCPRCRGQLEAAHYGPGGRVWAGTVVHVELPGRVPPYALVYVDLDDEGPRVLGHVAGEPRRLAGGTRVVLVGTSTGGDLLFDESR